jgi:hypothetical protein
MTFTTALFGIIFGKRHDDTPKAPELKRVIGTRTPEPTGWSIGSSTDEVMKFLDTAPKSMKRSLYDNAWIWEVHGGTIYFDKLGKVARYTQDDFGSIEGLVKPVIHIHA